MSPEACFSFEIATDGPGFLIDESESEVGPSLRLPPWLEPIRESVSSARIHPPQHIHPHHEVAEPR